MAKSLLPQPCGLKWRREEVVSQGNLGCCSHRRRSTPAIPLGNCFPLGKKGCCHDGQERLRRPLADLEVLHRALLPLCRFHCLFCSPSSPSVPGKVEKTKCTSLFTDKQQDRRKTHSLIPKIMKSFIQRECREHLPIEGRALGRHQ